ncbi:hypothetical protein FHT77_000460 [Rhizobium sp. BK181]|nr:hypothetical protein [Rhizobium sp. BK181]
MGFSLKTCLPGFECLHGRRNVEGIRGRDDDSVQVRVREHFRVVAERLLRCMCCRHPIPQVVGNIADGIKLGIFRLGSTFKVCSLGDRSASENINVEDALLVFHFNAFLSKPNIGHSRKT